MKLYMIIDSLELDVKSPENFTLQLDDNLCQKYTKVSRRHVFLRQETDVRRLFRSGGRIKPIYVHCSLLNMNDNIVNGRKSDVIAAIYCDDTRSRKTTLAYSLPNDSPKLLKSDNKIRLSLTTSDGRPVRAKFGVIYELEFS